MITKFKEIAKDEINVPITVSVFRDKDLKKDRRTKHKGSNCEQSKTQKKLHFVK